MIEYWGGQHAWAAEVRAALVALSETQREVLEMAYFEGLTQAEIAAALDVPLGTVKARMSRGMRQLAELVVNDTGVR